MFSDEHLISSLVPLGNGPDGHLLIYEHQALTLDLTLAFEPGMQG